MNPTAEKILFALYTENCGKKPQMNAAARSLGLTDEALGRAVNLLYTGRLVGGVAVKFGDSDDAPVSIITDDLLLTRRGAAHVEKALGLAGDAWTGEKLAKLLEKCRQPGWEGVRAIAERALASHQEKG